MWELLIERWENTVSQLFALNKQWNWKNVVIKCEWNIQFLAVFILFFPVIYCKNDKVMALTSSAENYTYCVNGDDKTKLYQYSQIFYSSTSF